VTRTDGRNAKSVSRETRQKIRNKKANLLITLSGQLILAVLVILSTLSELQAKDSTPCSWNQKNRGFEGQSPAKVCLFFDDGYYSVYYYAYPILKKHRLPATLGLVASKVQKPNTRKNFLHHLRFGFLNRNEVSEMIDSLGVEVASHSVTHRRLTEISDTMDLRYELFYSKQVLESLFQQEVITFVYPYGKYDDRILRLTQAAGYKIGRTTEFGEPNFWVAPLKVPIKEVRNTTTLDEIITHIKRFDITVLLFHRILEKPSLFTEFSVSRFDSLLTLLDSLKVKVMTLRGLYEEWRREVFAKAVIERGILDRKNWSDYLFQKVDIDQTRTSTRF